MSQPDFSKENGTPIAIINEKQEKRSLVELKNGKVVFKQKPISFDKLSETMQEIVKFREMLEQRIERRDSPLAIFPEEHKPLVAKLAHESDKTLGALAKHIRLELLPTQDEDDDNINSGTDVSASLPLSTIEAAIKSVLNRNNYGLDAPSSGGKVPAALCVWRWEVKEGYHDWLPKVSKEKADGRLAERVQAKKDLAAIFENLPQQERDGILDPKGTAKLPTKETNRLLSTNVSPAKIIDTEPTQSLKKQQKQEAEDEENDMSEATTSKPIRAKKEMDPEKAAKDKERLEKKAARAEKEKKEKEAQNKSRSIMANFFGKPKTNSARASPAQESDAAVAGPSSSRSEFEKTFRPFVVKKDAEIAPANWFLHVKTNKLRRKGRRIGEKEVIVIDDDDETEVVKTIIDVDMEDVPEVSCNVGLMNVKEHLAFILSTLPPSATPSFTTVPRRKLYTSHLTVRTILSQLSEAEIADNPTRVGTLLSILRNRTLLPAKVLIFTEDARPGYFGTWTRHSQIIGPRKPFARDLVALDYAYDSGEEWEEEGMGDADDVVEGAEEEEGDGATEADSDLDSWLVDDDDIGDVDIDADVEVETPLEGRETEVLLPVLNVQPKRKAEEGERKIGKKRKVVVPLVPFAKGPCWESNIGECVYESFQSYRIQLFNDTPYPIDPFTFISIPQERQVKVTPKFAVPSLPDRLLSIPINGMPSTSDPSSTTGSIPATKRTSSTTAPKTTFPDAHLPLLLSKMTALETSNITFLVDSIYQDLRTHKVKKNAIETKVREIGEKCKEKKVWIVKPGIAVHEVVAN